MKKALLALLVLMLLSATAAGSVVYSTFHGLKPATTAAFSDGTVPMLDGYTAAFAIPVDDAGHVALVDCGHDVAAKSIKASLAEHKMTPVALFITHAHPDHIGGCAQFPGIPLYALRAEVDAVEGRAGFKGPVPKMSGFKPTGLKVTSPLDDGADVDISGTHIHAIAAPGHTAGSVIYAAKKTLFFGDAATGDLEGHLRGAPWVFSDDTAQADASIAALPAKLASLKIDGIETYAFAHSGPLKANPVLLTEPLR